MDVLKPGQTGDPPVPQSPHTLITEFLPAMERFPAMKIKRVRCYAMERTHIPPARLAGYYFITCQTEGNTPSDMRGYVRSSVGYQP